MVGNSADKPEKHVKFELQEKSLNHFGFVLSRKYCSMRNLIFATKKREVDMQNTKMFNATWCVHMRQACSRQPETTPMVSEFTLWYDFPLNSKAKETMH
jgi:hypothetical protein